MTGGSTFCGISYFVYFKKPSGTGLWGRDWDRLKQGLSSQEKLLRPADPENPPALPFLASA